VGAPLAPVHNPRLYTPVAMAIERRRIDQLTSMCVFGFSRRNRRPAGPVPVTAKPGRRKPRYSSMTLMSASAHRPRGIVADNCCATVAGAGLTHWPIDSRVQTQHRHGPALPWLLERRQRGRQIVIFQGHESRPDVIQRRVSGRKLSQQPHAIDRSRCEMTAPL